MRLQLQARTARFEAFARLFEASRIVGSQSWFWAFARGLDNCELHMHVVTRFFDRGQRLHIFGSQRWFWTFVRGQALPGREPGNASRGNSRLQHDSRRWSFGGLEGYLAHKKQRPPKTL